MNHYRGALRLLICCLFIVSEACVASSARRDYQIRPGSGKGLVVVSFSQPTDDINWWYRDVAGAREHMLITADVAGHPLVRYGGTTLYPIELQAGEYEFFGWTALRGSPRGPAPSYEASEDGFLIRFRCVADQVTYIGNLQLDLVSENKFTLRVRDMHETDVEELVKAYRNIRPATIHVDLMEGPIRPDS
ncbi:MAG TPA: hypothetical protein VN181_15270 [Thermoanaerobaculia bacterium]|nr:hypothetical protein [Thermoanaerobaculia bacterium]